MAGSLLCGVAPNSISFIIGRAIAGLASGGIFSGSITIMAHSVPLRRRAVFEGALGSTFGVTPSYRSLLIEIAAFVGPIVGGAFTDRPTWRWCFYINLPLGAVTIAGIALSFQTSQLQTNKTVRERLNELDYLGPVFFIPAVVCLLLGLQWGGAQYPWKSPTIIGLFVGFGVIMSIWLYSQYRLGERATIPFRILTQQTVLFTSLYSFFLYSALVILMFYIPLYFQAVKGSTALASGVAILPLVVAMTLACIVGGGLITMAGYVKPFMVIGTAVFTVGVGLLSTLGVDTRFGVWFGYQVIAGIGMGINLGVLFPMSNVNEDADSCRPSRC